MSVSIHNDHGDLSFLLHNNIVHIILFNLISKKLKIFIAYRKKERWKRTQNRYCRIQTTMEKLATTTRMLYVHIILNGVIFLQILYDIVP